jgi:hypothetical protein
VEAEFRQVLGEGGKFSGERRAHVPLVAAAEVAHGVEVVVTGNHLNRTATSGYVARLVLLDVYQNG